MNYEYVLKSLTGNYLTDLGYGYLGFSQKKDEAKRFLSFQEANDFAKHHHLNNWHVEEVEAKDE